MTVRGVKEDTTREDNRYVRVRCPICDMTSPVVDQRIDIRRTLMFEWWRKHLRGHKPTPIIERAERGPAS